MLRLKLLIMTYFIEKPLSTIRQFSKICSFVKIVKTDRFVLAIAALPYLQVESNRSGNTSVLVFVHGGSNRDGMGSMLEGDILAGHGGIIVVTINYRLGIYGESGRLKSSTWALNVKSKDSPNFFFPFSLASFIIFAFAGFKSHGVLKSFCILHSIFDGERESKSKSFRFVFLSQI